MAEQQTIDMTPDEQGYALMATIFAENIVGQVKGGAKGKENARALMGSVINIAAHLGNAMAKGDKDAKNAYEWLSVRFPQGK